MRDKAINAAGSVVAIGCAALDIHARTAGDPVPAESNPGVVRWCAGGVARNVAHSLARLGARTTLVAPFGDDAAAQFLRASCVEAGLCLAHAPVRIGASTPCYVSVADAAGELTVAVADTALVETLTPDDLPAAELASAAAVVIDANLAPATLEAVVALAADTPVFADPVSAPKARRLLGCLDGIDTLTPSRAEAEALSGVRIDNERRMAEAADWLHGRGVRRVVITLGAEGAWYSSDDDTFFAPAASTTATFNVAGAGDAFLAGLVYGSLHDLSMEDGMRLARSLAASAVASETNVPQTFPEAPEQCTVDTAHG